MSGQVRRSITAWALAAWVSIGLLLALTTASGI